MTDKSHLMKHIGKANWWKPKQSNVWLLVLPYKAKRGQVLEDSDGKEIVINQLAFWRDNEDDEGYTFFYYVVSSEAVQSIRDGNEAGMKVEKRK